MSTYIVALDQGTSSSRAVLYDESGRRVDVVQQAFRQIFPKPGWVEHDAEEIWRTQRDVFRKLLKKNGLSASDIAATGITNQRETTVLWDKQTGQPVHHALVWQDTRTSDWCERLKADGHTELIRQKTGLVPDSYFSATKIKWILEQDSSLRKRAARGEILFGTIDTWLLWKMTGGKVHATDYSNASRTMLYNIRSLEWDEELLKLFDIPHAMLPEVKPSSGVLGFWEQDGVRIPIAGVAGDQQAALFGQTCFEAGDVKNTYGTGCFMLMNTGQEARLSANGLLTTIAWGVDGKVEYALEGSVFIAGAVIQWLRDALGLIRDTAETEAIAEQVQGDNPVYFVPAFAGLGAPYWDMYARGGIFGLTRDTGRAHIVRAALESLAYQTKDLLNAMQQDSGVTMNALRVDGGAAANDFLMQFQADILNVPVFRPADLESTARGAAYLAGMGIGMWDKNTLQKQPHDLTEFRPSFTAEKRDKLYSGWKDAVRRTRGN